jgi:CheY-like chemotaxis protein
VVEDNPLVGAMATGMLSSMGYSPVVVISASSAIAELERPDPIALLLTDILLPGGMTGVDLARQARRRWPNLPILFMSGFADPSLVPDDFRANTQLLTKPFRLGQLSEAIVFALAGTIRAGVIDSDTSNSTARAFGSGASAQRAAGFAVAKTASHFGAAPRLTSWQHSSPDDQ